MGCVYQHIPTALQVYLIIAQEKLEQIIKKSKSLCKVLHRVCNWKLTDHMLNIIDL